MSEQRHDTRRLVELVTGGLDAAEARRLRRRAQEDPALGRELARLERVWGALDDAPETAVPPGFAGRVMADVREAAREEARSQRLSWPTAPLWARAAGALALVAGLTTGAVLGGGLAAEHRLPGDAAEPISIYDSSVSTNTLADDYADVLAAFDDGEGS